MLLFWFFVHWIKLFVENFGIRILSNIKFVTAIIWWIWWILTQILISLSQIFTLRQIYPKLLFNCNTFQKIGLGVNIFKIFVISKLTLIKKLLNINFVRFFLIRGKKSSNRCTRVRLVVKKKTFVTAFLGLRRVGGLPINI